MFKLYIPYVVEFEESRKLVTELRAQRPRFDFFMRLQERCEGCVAQDLLILPVQRIPRYLLLLQGILNHTNNESETLGPAQAAFTLISQIANTINASFSARDAQRRVVDIKACLEAEARFLNHFVTPNRRFVLEGTLRISNAGEFKSRMAFLFNDLLVVTKQEAPKAYKLKWAVPLQGLTAVAGTSRSPRALKNEEFAIELNGRDWATGKPVLLHVAADNVDDFSRWLDALTKHIAEVTRKEDSFKAGPGS
jgi:hypothetical protein